MKMNGNASKIIENRYFAWNIDEVSKINEKHVCFGVGHSPKNVLKHLEVAGCAKHIKTH